jgi:hypothetical protein
MQILLSTSFRASFLRNLICIILWWIIFFPGFYSGDSFEAVEMAKSGILTNSGTASWALYVRVFSFFGNAFPVLTLFSGAMLIYGTTQLAYVLFEKRVAALSSFLMCTTALVSGMGITLWHDIPFTSGLLLVSSFFVELLKNQWVIHKNKIFYLLIPGSVLISFRPNGVPTLIVFAILMLFSNATRKGLKYLVASILLSTTITLGLSNALLGMSPINAYFGQEWMRSDISCFASTSEGNLFIQRKFPEIRNSTDWASSEACTFLNKANLSLEYKMSSVEFVPSIWAKLLLSEPGFILKTHLLRHAYLIPFPFSGIPTEPFLHSTIEFTDRGISWAFPTLAEKARVIVRAWNASRGITGWAGIWLISMVLFLKYGKQTKLLPIIQMSVSLMGIVFVVAPVRDGRYILFVLVASQLALLGNIVNWIQSRSKRRPAD